MRSIHCPLSFFILCPDATSILNILMNGPLCFIYLFPSSSRQPAVTPSLTYKSKGGYGIFILLTVKAQTLGMLVVNLREECCVFSAWLRDLYVTDSQGSDPGHASCKSEGGVLCFFCLGIDQPEPKAVHCQAQHHAYSSCASRDHQLNDYQQIKLSIRK